MDRVLSCCGCDGLLLTKFNVCSKSQHLFRSSLTKERRKRKAKKEPCNHSRLSVLLFPRSLPLARQVGKVELGLLVDTRLAVSFRGSSSPVKSRSSLVVLEVSGTFLLLPFTLWRFVCAWEDFSSPFLLCSTRLARARARSRASLFMTRTVCADTRRAPVRFFLAGTRWLGLCARPVWRVSPLSTS
jgi:hypothetical protein